MKLVFIPRIVCNSRNITWSRHTDDEVMHDFLEHKLYPKKLSTIFAEILILSSLE